MQSTQPGLSKFAESALRSGRTRDAELSSWHTGAGRHRRTRRGVEHVDDDVCVDVAADVVQSRRRAESPVLDTEIAKQDRLLAEARQHLATMTSLRERV